MFLENGLRAILMFLIAEHCIASNGADQCISLSSNETLWSYKNSKLPAVIWIKFSWKHKYFFTLEYCLIITSEMSLVNITIESKISWNNCSIDFYVKNLKYKKISIINETLDITKISAIKINKVNNKI